MAVAFVRGLLVLVVAAAPPLARTAAPAETPKLARWFGSDPGAFVLYDGVRNRYVRHDEKRCAERFSPCSSFKIPNALIGLETGVIEDAQTVIQWTPALFTPEGPAKPPYDEWTRDHTLRSAMKHSVLWYFQQIARRVGEAKYGKYLEEFDYGNRDISAGLDRFWLASSLKISANEQVEFLRRLYTGRLPVSARSVGIVKDILVLEDTGDYRLSGKTGTGPISKGRYLGWLVGYVEREGRVSFFALNVEGPDYESISKDRRLELTKGILKDLGILP